MTSESTIFERVVTDADTAAVFGSDFPPVASTPFVLGLAEVACHNIIASRLSDGEITVGVRAIVDHLLPSPIGAYLVVEAHLEQREERLLHFRVEVRDGERVAAHIEHIRVIVQAEKILEKVRRS